MKQEIIIVPLTGLTVKVSEDSNTVTIDGTDRVQGYAMSGEWTVESEDAPWPENEWDWHGVVHAPLDTVLISLETIYALCFLLRRSDMRYAVLTRREDGRYYFLYVQDAAVNSWEDSNQSEMVFDGYLPYPITIYDGEVEVVGRAVPDLLNRLYETRGGHGNVWHTSDERPEDDSQVLIIDRNDLGTAGDYGAEGDYFAADAGGVCDDWNEWHITRWAYIKDLLPEEITEKDSKQ